MGLWSFFWSLWRWWTPPPPPEARPTEAPPSEPPVIEVAPAAALDEPTDEDDGWEAEDEDDDDEDHASDSFISAAPEPTDAELEQRRTEARAEALAGEHRIYLSMPAGPGSLAEALNQLSAEGLVEAEFVDDGEGEPHILYRPT